LKTHDGFDATLYPDNPRRTVKARMPRDSGEGTIMSWDTRTVADASLDGRGKDEPVAYRAEKRGQRSIVLALLAAVILLDQAMKWWAWRHVPESIINSGGDWLVGSTVGAWYAGPVSGALLDLLDFGVLSIVLSVLVRRRRPAVVLVPGVLMIGGWTSNLLDRLGLHYWTAPDSVRGAVDFIPVGSHYANVADFFIVGATPVFLLAVGYLALRPRNEPIKVGPTTPGAHPRPAARTSALAAAVGLILAASLGAAHYGGVSAPDTSAGASAGASAHK
jgi:lipoprotein signal peptidase